MDYAAFCGQQRIYNSNAGNREALVATLAKLPLPRRARILYKRKSNGQSNVRQNHCLCAFIRNFSASDRTSESSGSLEGSSLGGLQTTSRDGRCRAVIRMQLAFRRYA